MQIIRVVDGGAELLSQPSGWLMVPLLPTNRFRFPRQEVIMYQFHENSEDDI
jgi:hypothetical protein